jgi:type IV secretory pathway VirB2 component (pilin)
VVFTLFGILVVYAAVTFAPQKASGVDEALQEIAQAPAGPILLTLVALGLIAFGLYSCTEARYRRFEA